MSVTKKLSPLHILIILFFVFITITLLYLPKHESNKKPIVQVSIIDTSLSVDITPYFQKDKDIESLLKDYQQKKINPDSLIQFFNAKKLPHIAAYFEEIKNLQSDIDTIWFNIGKNYYSTLGFISDPVIAEQLIASAARCFNKALSLNDKNKDAKIMLASCYVQTNNPMLGVKMLREIEKTDSNNVLLQMQLAEFSLRSNQLDRAIQRYQKALQLDSNRTEIYAYLSEIYMQKKDTLQSIYFIRKFAAHISDTALKNSIYHYIETLNKNNH